MSKMYRCDICEETFEGEPFGFLKGNSGNEDFVSLLYTFNAESRVTGNHDICEDCFKEILKKKES